MRAITMRLTTYGAPRKPAQWRRAGLFGLAANASDDVTASRVVQRMALRGTAAWMLRATQ